MMSSNDQEFQPVDKKCRLCGFADADNTNIFHGTYSVLLAKILVVYPLILYQDDPLPKSICRKCVNNVNVMYADIQRVMKNQAKWISNVRSVQPDHNYIKLLDLIENSNTVTRNSIKIALGVDICSQSINRSLFVHKEQLAPQKKAASSPPKVASKNEEQKAAKEQLGAENDVNAEDLALSMPSPKRHRPSSDEEPVNCPYCKKEFSTAALLAVHQVTHLRLSVSNIYERKVLPKKLRRGRLITSNDQKCIRCLNCWCIFPDSNNILEHWAQGTCNFYCQLCGEEFPQSAKSLRSHVLAVHKITHRSLRAHRPRVEPVVAKDARIKPITIAKTVATTPQSEDASPQLYRVIQKHQPATNDLKVSPQEQEEAVPTTTVKQEQVEHTKEDPRNALVITEIKQEPWDNPGTTAPEPVQESSQLRTQLFKAVHTQPQHNVELAFVAPAQHNNIIHKQGALPPQPDNPRVVAPRLEALLRDPPKPPPPMTSVHSILRNFTRTSPVIVRAISQSPAAKPPDALSKPETLEGENCPVCGFVFKNIAQRIAHSHMHQKQAAFAANNNNNQTPYQNSSTVMSYAPSNNPTFRIQPMPSPVVCKPQPVPVTVGTTTASVLRGVRTKFVDRRKDGVIPSTGGIKVKSLTDLRNGPTPDPPSTNNQSTTRKSWVMVPKEPPPPKNDDEIMDLEQTQASDTPEQAATGSIIALVCGNCHLHFPTRLDFFRHKRNCQAITCEYCKATFAQKYEYQLHVMQTHNSSISFNIKTKNS